MHLRCIHRVTSNDSCVQVPWVQMMEASVQTETVAEEDLDWDLSNLEDRETQTLPQNPTPFRECV